MKALVILGSRNPKGQTARAAEALSEGLKEGGVKTDKVFLPEIKIEHCGQCEDHGWGICRTEGKCTIKDDFDSLANKVKDADAVIFANPVYFGDLSESMRAFLDRLRRVNRFEATKYSVKDKPAIGICVAGGGGGGAMLCSVSMERVLNTCGFSVIDLIPVRRQNLDMKIDILKITGKWLASKFSL